VLIDNLPKLQFDAALELFHSLQRLSRVFIVTTDDDTLKERDLDAAGPWIEIIEQRKLTAADVRAFIAHRVPKYRSRNFALPDASPDLALFPFAVSATETAVGGNTGSKPLRAVNTWLVRQIEQRHRELVERKNLVDLAAAQPAELRERMIG
jgi:hypothetical protein